MILALYAILQRWLNLRKEDLGILWEHIVLNELQGQLQTKEIRYWRDKQDHEFDFILLLSRNTHPIVIECKWKAGSFATSHKTAVNAASCYISFFAI